MSKKDTYVRKSAIIIFFFLLVLLAIAFILQFKIVNFQDIFKKDTNPPPALETNKIDLPVPLNQPNIRQVYLLYSFYGRIKLVEATGDDVQLILDVSDPILPSFILNSKDSQIIKMNSSGSQKFASVDDLKPGLTINIQIKYDLRLNTWKIIRVYIF